MMKANLNTQTHSHTHKNDELKAPVEKNQHARNSILTLHKKRRKQIAMFKSEMTNVFF